MLKINSLGEMVEVNEYDVHQTSEIKPIENVDSFNTTQIVNEKDLNKKHLKNMADDISKAFAKRIVFEEKMKSIKANEKKRLDYENQVLRDREQSKIRMDAINRGRKDSEMDAYLSYKEESQDLGKSYHKSMNAKSLNGGHFRPTADYDKYHSGNAYGLNKTGRTVVGQEVDTLISRSHLSNESMAYKEEYLSEAEEAFVRKNGIGSYNPLRKRQDVTVPVIHRRDMGGFFDDLISDAKQKIDSALTYDNLKDQAAKLITQATSSGGTVQTLPSGQQVITMPNQHPYYIPMQPQGLGIDTKTMVMVGGFLAGLVVLTSVLRRR